MPYSGWRFVARDVTLADGKVVSDAIALGDAPAASLVRGVVRRLLPSSSPSPSPSPSKESRARRWWPWAVGGGAAAVLGIGLGVGIGLATSTPDHAIGGDWPGIQ